MGIEVDRDVIELVREFRMTHSARARAAAMHDADLAYWEQSARVVTRRLLAYLLGRLPSESEVDRVTGLDVPH